VGRIPAAAPGVLRRLSFALGDVYVDQRNRGTFWQVPQFGSQNLYDPELSEWLRVDTFRQQPGAVRLLAHGAPARLAAARRGGGGRRPSCRRTGRVG
jgi:hypothetical protein